MTPDTSQRPDRTLVRPTRPSFRAPGGRARRRSDGSADVAEATSNLVPAQFAWILMGVPAVMLCFFAVSAVKQPLPPRREEREELRSETRAHDYNTTRRPNPARYCGHLCPGCPPAEHSPRRCKLPVRFEHYASSRQIHATGTHLWVDPRQIGRSLGRTCPFAAVCVTHRRRDLFPGHSPEPIHARAGCPGWEWYHPGPSGGQRQPVAHRRGHGRHH
jgi:hypothetical protein